jgi:hypothetical protein
MKIAHTAILHGDSDDNPIADVDFSRVDLLGERGGGETGSRGECEKKCQAQRTAKV